MTKEEFEKLNEVQRLEVFVNIQADSMDVLTDCIKLLQKRIENLEKIILKKQ